jgi:hypothetical protein
VGRRESLNSNCVIFSQPVLILAQFEMVRCELHDRRSEWFERSVDRV